MINNLDIDIVVGMRWYLYIQYPSFEIVCCGIKLLIAITYCYLIHYSDLQL